MSHMLHHLVLRDQRMTQLTSWSGTAVLVLRGRDWVMPISVLWRMLLRFHESNKLRDLVKMQIVSL